MKGREYFEETRRVYSRIMQFGAVDVSVWIRRRDTYGALEQLASEVLKPKQREDMIECNELRRQRQRRNERENE